MTATPAQVANDLVLQADYFANRDEPIATACHDCARLIRAFLAEEDVDDRTYTYVWNRMFRMIGRYRDGAQIDKSVRRGLKTLQGLNEVPRK